MPGDGIPISLHCQRNIHDSAVVFAKVGIKNRKVYVNEKHPTAGMRISWRNLSDCPGASFLRDIEMEDGLLSHTLLGERNKIYTTTDVSHALPFLSTTL
jgi:hypothetical protein